MTLQNATELTFEPVRNLFNKAIDALGTSECDSYMNYINSLGDIDEKADAKIAFYAFTNMPRHEAYDNALTNIMKNHKGNVNELMAYRSNVKTLIEYVGELELQIYAWRYVAERFLDSMENANKRWNDEDDNELIEMACNDIPEVFMAAKLKRSPSSIKTRISYLVGTKRLSQKVAGKFIGKINGEQTEANLVGTIYKG